MIKALIKKQFQEVFRTYFVNAKTNKGRSKKGILGMFLFFAAVMLFLCVLFGFMSYGLCSMLAGSPLEWLIYAIIGIVSVFLGVFGSVFNTYAALYMARDNEMLLSMPIPASRILLSRVALVFGMSFLYSGVVWIPGIIVSWFQGVHSQAGVIFGILLAPLVSLFVTVLTCALGWLVALAASRLKNKSFLVVIITLVFLGGYYAICFRMSDIMEYVVQNREKLGAAFKKWLGLIYYLGMAANGDFPGMFVFTAVTAVLSAVCFFLLSKSFSKILTANTQGKKAVFKAASIRRDSFRMALFKREWKRFASSPTYMLNCGLGIVILIVLAVLALIKKADLQGILFLAFVSMKPLYEMLPLAVMAVICMIAGLDCISTPSVSLEGRNLWILRTLPVSGRDVMQVKLALHVVLNTVPAIFASVVIHYCLKTEAVMTLLGTLFCVLFIVLDGCLGLIIGVLRPNFHWTSEAMPIKSSINVILSMLVGLIVPAALVGIFYLLHGALSMTVYMLLANVVMAILTVLAAAWVMTKGAEVFETLQ